MDCNKSRVFLPSAPTETLLVAADHTTQPDSAESLRLLKLRLLHLRPRRLTRREYCPWPHRR
jgi:hypothetical protein